VAEDAREREQEPPVAEDAREREQEPPETAEPAAAADEPPAAADGPEEPGEGAGGEAGEADPSPGSATTTKPGMAWFIVRAQAEREEKIKEALEAQVRAAGLEKLFGRVLVPREHLSEVRGGKRRIMQQKILPGYILIEMAFTDESWFVVVETPGISGFVGSDRRRPLPMPEAEVQMLLREIEEKRERPRPKVAFEVGETVKIKEGPFENFDGTVEEIYPARGRLKISIEVFSRSTSVELEYSKVEKV